jgi:hypothetical protein
METGFIRQYGYLYQVTIIPLKALFIFLYASSLHDIHVGVCSDYRQYCN